MYKQFSILLYQECFIIADAGFPGGDEETRTPDLRRAKAALYQLSYIP